MKGSGTPMQHRRTHIPRFITMLVGHFWTLNHQNWIRIFKYPRCLATASRSFRRCKYTAFAFEKQIIDDFFLILIHKNGATGKKFHRKVIWHGIKTLRWNFLQRWRMLLDKRPEIGTDYRTGCYASTIQSCNWPIQCPYGLNSTLTSR